jgi:hypothetical protein
LAAHHNLSVKLFSLFHAFYRAKIYIFTIFLHFYKKTAHKTLMKLTAGKLLDARARVVNFQ